MTSCVCVCLYTVNSKRTVNYFKTTIKSIVSSNSQCLNQNNTRQIVYSTSNYEGPFSVTTILYM